jgi:protein TonB
MMASLVLTSGLISIIILGLSSREGASDHEHGPELALFDVAQTVDRAQPVVLETGPEPDHPKPRAPVPPPDHAHRVSRWPVDAVRPEVVPPAMSLVPGGPPSAHDAELQVATRWAASVSDAARQPSKPQPTRAAPTLPRQGSSNYAARILAWLERHKRFPEGQVRDALDATVLVAFTIDRRGRANDLRVVNGSGIGWLDTLALRQVRSASPFPRPPESAEVDGLRFEVPMRYRTG